MRRSLRWVLPAVLLAVVGPGRAPGAPASPGVPAVPDAAASGGPSVPGLPAASAPPAWSSPTVPLDETVYTDLDRLEALGLLPGEILGFKPLARAEIARIVGAASRRAAASRSPARELLIRLRREYPEQAAGEDQGINAIRFGAAWTNSKPEPLLRDNKLGTIEGVVDPLTAYRQGERFARGGTGWLQTHHAHNLGQALAFGLGIDARVLIDRSDPSGCFPARTTTKGHNGFRAFYGRLRLGPVVVQAGRDAVAWGPLPRGGFLASTNARPLDMVFISHESPYRLPWVFRHAGAHRAGLFVADLGGERTFPHTLLVGLRASFRPLARAEMGFTETLLMGGEGAPRPTLVEVLRQAFPMGKMGPGSDYSDHRFGFDYRLQLWPGRLLLYGELFVDDGRRGQYGSLTAHRTGLFFPALGRRGAFDARLEFARLPALCYRHGQWATGYTLDGRLLGDELGPDSRGLRGEFQWTGDAGDRLELEISWEGRDADTWGQVPRPPPADPGDYGAIYRITDLPTEWRLRADLALDRPVSSTVTLRPRIAAERIRNVRQAGGSLATRLMAELGVRVRFGPH